MPCPPTITAPVGQPLLPVPSLWDSGHTVSFPGSFKPRGRSCFPSSFPRCLLSSYGGLLTPPTSLDNPTALPLNHLIGILCAARIPLATGRSCAVKAPGTQTQTGSWDASFPRRKQAGCPCPCPSSTAAFPSERGAHLPLSPAGSHRLPLAVLTLPRPPRDPASHALTQCSRSLGDTAEHFTKVRPSTLCPGFI